MNITDKNNAKYCNFNYHLKFKNALNHCAKYIFIVLILFGVISVASTTFADEQYTFGSASASGAWYPLAVSMSKVISENIPGINVTGVVTPGAGRENVNRIDQGDMEFGWVLANTLYAANKGLDPFEKKMKVVGWFTAYPAIMHVIASKRSGIESMSDIKGKTVVADIPGQQSSHDVENILFPAHGLIPGEDFKLEKVRFPEAIQKVIDGHADAIAFYMGPGVPGFHQLADSKDVVFIPIEESAREKILESDPTLYIGELPANIYKGQDEVIKAMCMAYQTVVSSELDEDIVYEATKAVWENKEFIESSTAVFKHAKIENVYDGMSAPVHPGAKKYFKERGVTPD